MRHARFRRFGLLAAAVVLADHAPAAAGMPSVNLSDAASLRLQTLSFFLVVFLLSALVIRWAWNALRGDFPRLPRLSYPKALGLVALWGVLFLLVLTMISGARELMTPGAWKRDGLTYTLDDRKAPTPEPSDQERMTRLKGLYAVLAAHAARQDGQYPPAETASIPAGEWKTAHPSGMRFRYVPGRTVRDAGKVLAYEPELFGEVRLVLFADGEVRRMTSAELAPLLAVEGR
jgi:hypothetical protein